MTYVSDLYLNRCSSAYILEWFFEELNPKALSFQVQFDDEVRVSAWHNLADQVNGYYPYRSSIFIRPQRFMTLRVLRLTVFDGYKDDKPKPLSHFSFVNFPRYLTMIERYD
jgi:hypothetical protein